MPVEFEVNISALTASSEYIGSIARRVPLEGLRRIAKGALLNTFERAIEDANYDGGFPEEFQSHTMRIIRNFESFYLINDGYDIFVSVDFDELGTQDELRRAFHQGAKLAEGGYLWGPYEGQELASDEDDPHDSHAIWEAVRFKHDKVTTKKGKQMPVSKLPYQWDEIVDKYVEIWGDKAPEWLFMQYGQEEYSPYIPQIDIIGNFKTEFFREASYYLEEFFYSEVAIANAYETVGVKVGFTSRGQPRLEAGSLVNPATGKTIRRGQFAPKL